MLQVSSNHALEFILTTKQDVPNLTQAQLYERTAGFTTTQASTEDAKERSKNVALRLMILADKCRVSIFNLIRPHLKSPPLGSRNVREGITQVASVGACTVWDRFERSCTEGWGILRWHRSRIVVERYGEGN